jgi:hypothetical protein
MYVRSTQLKNKKKKRRRRRRRRRKYHITISNCKFYLHTMPEEPDPYNKSIIGNQIQQPEKAPEKPKLDLFKILTDAAIRHPGEVNKFLDDYVGAPGKSLIISSLNEAKPELSPIINKIFPIKSNSNHNGNGRSEHLDDDINPLDDNDDDKDYSIPDTEILNEIRQFACDMHLGGYGWAQISDSIYAKFDVDWNPLKVKDIVLKNLAWNHRTLQSQPQSQPQSTIPLEAPQKPQEQKVGLIRTVLRKLW